MRRLVRGAKAGRGAYHRSGWRQTEYHRPRFWSRHFGSAQFRFSVSSDIVAATPAGCLSASLFLSSEPNHEQAATGSAAAITIAPNLTFLPPAAAPRDHNAPGLRFQNNAQHLGDPAWT